MSAFHLMTGFFVEEGVRLLVCDHETQRVVVARDGAFRVAVRARGDWEVDAWISVNNPFSFMREASLCGDTLVYVDEDDNRFHWRLGDGTLLGRDARTLGTARHPAGEALFVSRGTDALGHSLDLHANSGRLLREGVVPHLADLGFDNPSQIAVVKRPTDSLRMAVLCYGRVGVLDLEITAEHEFEFTSAFDVHEEIVMDPLFLLDQRGSEIVALHGYGCGLVRIDIQTEEVRYCPIPPGGEYNYGLFGSASLGPNGHALVHTKKGPWLWDRNNELRRVPRELYGVIGSLGGDWLCLVDGELSCVAWPG